LKEKLDQYQAVSIDIFDTILFRTCETPSDVFLEAGRRSLAEGYVPDKYTPFIFRDVRIVAEKRAREEAKRRSGHDEVTYNQIYDFMPDDIHKREVQRLEWEVELEMTYANPVLVALMEAIKASGKRIFLMSDMYLASSQIEELLASAGISKRLYDRIFVSNEHGCGKSGGHLFRKLLACYPEYDPSDIVHIGDNVTADCEGALQAGIQSIAYKVIPSGIQYTYQWEKIRHHLQLDEVYAVRKLAQAQSAEEQENLFWYEFGATVLGPFMTVFCDWVVDLAIKKGSKGIYPFMREGALLTPMLRQAIERRGVDLDVRSIYLSRQSTYFAGLERFSVEVIKSLAERNHLTLADLFDMFELDMEDTAFTPYHDVPLKAMNRITVEQREQEVTLQDLVYRWFEREDIKTRIEAMIAKKRDMFLDYLDQTVSSLENIITVDLGFKGTIQQSIENALRIRGGRHAITHLLAFGAEPIHKLVYNGVDIRAFIGYSREQADLIRSIMRSPEFLEELLMGDEGSTIGYQYGLSGRVEPVKAELPYGRNEVEYKKSCHRGVMTFQSLYYNLMEAKPYLREKLIERRSEWCKLIHRVVEVPTPDEANFLGSLSHDANFGSQHVSTICNEDVDQLIDKLGLETLLDMSSYGYHATEVYWPQGAVTRKDSLYLIKPYIRQSQSFGYLTAMNRLAGQLMMNGHRKFAIYGAGEVGQTLLQVAKLNGLEVECFIDRKEMLWGTQIDGVSVISLNEAELRGIEVFAIGSLSFTKEIERDILLQYQRAGKQPLIFKPY
jgi:predicted HAD superfamily hydrolase